MIEYKIALASGCLLAKRSMPREKIGSSSLVSTIVARIVVKTVGEYKATGNRS